MGQSISLQNVYLRTSDMTASCAFYEHLLGIQPIVTDGTHWTQYRIGDRNFALSSADEVATNSKGATIVFEVPGLSAIEELATALGGQILGRRDMGSHGRTITVADPAGDVVQFLMRVPSGMPVSTSR